jgi:hypothetical protein
MARVVWYPSWSIQSNYQLDNMFWKGQWSLNWSIYSNYHEKVLTRPQTGLFSQITVWTKRSGKISRTGRFTHHGQKVLARLVWYPNWSIQSNYPYVQNVLERPLWSLTWSIYSNYHEKVLTRPQTGLFSKITIWTKCSGKASGP